MIEEIRKIIEIFLDKSKHWTLRAGIFISILGFIFIVDFSLNLSYNYHLSNKLEHLEKINSLKKVYENDSLKLKNILETENYQKYFPLIANKDEFKQIEYFFIVKEAKNVMESSLLPFGSNSATAEISQSENKSEADNITSEQEEPSIDTQKVEQSLKELLNKF